MTPATDPVAAYRELEAAEAKIAAAQRSRDEARERLDAALAACGWRRATGAFSPGSALYSRLGGNLVTLRAVLDDLERERERQAAV